MAEGILANPASGKKPGSWDVRDLYRLYIVCGPYATHSAQRSVGTRSNHLLISVQLLIDQTLPKHLWKCCADLNKEEIMRKSFVNGQTFTDNITIKYISAVTSSPVLLFIWKPSYQGHVWSNNSVGNKLFYSPLTHFRDEHDTYNTCSVVMPCLEWSYHKDKLVLTVSDADIRYNVLLLCDCSI